MCSSPRVFASRLVSVDAIRGAVMVLMALDHVRDFFHSSAISFNPTDLTKTSPILFLTRWITHFCMPVFMFMSGTGAFLWWQRGGHTRRQLAHFLWTRGIWFVFLELTVMQFAYDFNLPSRFLILLLVLWIFGICMLAMSPLVLLPIRWLLVFGLLVIATHDALNGIDASRFGAFAPLWNLIHQPGVFVLGGKSILSPYTIVPWIAVMTLGFCFGELLQGDPATRQRISRTIGLSAVAAFVVLRTINRYGNPAPWSVQKSSIFTALSFLNCTKYPASLDFLLMTLGPALLVFAWFDRHPPKITNPLVIFGRVPLFYFVLHFYLIHALVVLFAFVRYGGSAFNFIFNPVPPMGGPAKLFPKDFGYSLTVTYMVWLLVVASLYPVCRWYARIKSSGRSKWFSYI